MARYELLLPKMGESVAEATIIKWVKKPGDLIQADDTVVEIATDKVDSDVPSPVKGKLVETLSRENEIVQVGSAIAIIETEDGEETPSATDEEAAVATFDIEEPESESADEPDAEKEEAPAVHPVKEPEEKTAAPSQSSSRFYSPLVRSIAAEEGIPLTELDNIKGSGLDDRITKQDILEYIQQRRSSGISGSEKKGHASQQRSVKHAEGSFDKTTTASSVPVSDTDEIIEMDRMRRMIADHMVMSKHTSPHVTSFVEADVTNIVQWRNRVKDTFEKREGEKITYTPIFIEAVIKAIKDFPMINVSVNDMKIIKKRDINIGMATALPSGNLIVPVIKNAGQLNLTGITKAVNDLAGRARNNQLKPDEVMEGTFTITNIGSFGNIMGTPIINQPQVAVLALGAIKKKPAVIETEFGDMIVVRQLMYLSLSYDHRVVDGALGGLFLKKISDYLEAWDPEREI